MHVLYIWKALGTGMLDMMFSGVWHANTQTQIHKYSVYTNTVNDEMSVNPMKCYIFGKPLMQGCRIWYLELLTLQIQNKNTQIQCIYKYPNLQLYVLQMGAWPYPPWLVSCIERSVLIPEWTTPQSVLQPNFQTCAWPYPPWLVSFIERSVLISEWTTPQSVFTQT